MNADAIVEALKRLSQKMVYAQCDPIELVICGGAGLILTGLISRATKDVDIVALAHRNGAQLEILQDRRLPKELTQMIADVGRELGIDHDWLNFAASPLLRFGLPPHLATRLTRKSYGACLTAHFISRLDQVYFKIYAAMHPNQGHRHLSDLLDLKPTADEVEKVVGWLLARKPSRQFKNTLKQILERIGHERITEHI